MAGVDDAEAVAFCVGQYHEVNIAGAAQRTARGTTLHEPVDLGRLLGRAVVYEVEMDPRPLLDRRDRTMHSDPVFQRGRVESRMVKPSLEPGNLTTSIAQHLRPEGGGTVHIVGT